VRLADLGLALGQIDLGRLDADADHKLADYFVTTEHAKVALSGRRTLFLGRKGSGKTALFLQLPRLYQESGRRLGVVQVTPDQYAWAALKEYQEQGILAEQAHTNAWRLTLGIETAAYLLAAEDIDWSLPAEGALDRLRKFMSDNYGDFRPDLLRTARSLIKGVRSFNLTAFGFGVGAARDIDAITVTPAAIDALFELLNIVLQEYGLVILLDRLDDSWDGSAESKTLLVGLLKAAKDLNDRLGLNEDDAGLSVIVFLRSDIYDALQFDDKDKHRPTEDHITWSTTELREMVGRRMPPDVEVSDLFEVGEMRGSIAPFNYILKRTFLRPREVLQFLEECRREAGYSVTEISKDDIRAAEDRYSHWKVDDLKQEFRKVYPFFDFLIDAFRNELHRYDSFAEVEEMLKAKIPSVVQELGFQRILDILYEASVIGVRVSNAGSPRFKSEKVNSTLPGEGAVYVHQSLLKGLNVREARKAAPGEEEKWGEPLNVPADLKGWVVATTNYDPGVYDSGVTFVPVVQEQPRLWTPAAWRRSRSRRDSDTDEEREGQ
jgi:hypothetical protein